MLINFPKNCPSCQTIVEVTECTCPNCNTKVSGKFQLPPLLTLSTEEQQFIIDFLMSSGSLKEMANKIGVSYPTMRNKLDDLIQKLKTI